MGSPIPKIARRGAGKMTKLGIGLCLGLVVLVLCAGTKGFSFSPRDEPPSDLKALHKDDMEAFAKRFEKEGRPEQARDLRKRWLDTKRRETLDPLDADGRIALGDQYETLIDDKKTAASLYLEALALDPAQQKAIDGLVRLGYRKERNDWVAPEGSKPAAVDRPSPAPAARSTEIGGGLRGLTQAEVLRRLGGKPDRIVRVATQGSVVEQWIYRGGRASQYINFQAGGSLTRPIVAEQFTLPETADSGASR